MYAPIHCAPGLTAKEEKCLSYSFIYEVYGKMLAIQKLYNPIYTIYSIYIIHYCFWSHGLTEPKLCAYPLHTRADGHRRKIFIRQFHS